tara:strand:- start:424 stop:1119 length:696 start_codon:yes stop_codon:yes gene_type:complete
LTIKAKDLVNYGIILLCRDDEYSRLAAEKIVSIWGANVDVFYQKGNERPENFRELIARKIAISFRSLIVLTQAELDAVALAVNFHPAPPEYPGVGGYNFAIYEQAREYGVTLHLMSAKVDSGSIISVKRFPIQPDVTVAELKDRANVEMLKMLDKFIKDLLLLGEDGLLKLISNQIEVWNENTISRKKLNDLCTVSLNLSAEEIKKRLRACHYPPKYGLDVVINGKTYNLL